jgi:thiamine biosynthesis protein ThiS
MQKPKLIEITINDEPEQVPQNSSLEALIRHFAEADPHLIVELNGRFVYPRDYSSTRISARDRIEFINPNFGG